MTERRVAKTRRRTRSIDLADEEHTQEAREAFVAKVLRLFKEKREKFKMTDVPDAPLPNRSYTTLATMTDGSKYYVGFTLEGDPRRPAVSYDISAKQRPGTMGIHEGAYYRLDLCGGQGALDDITILAGRGQTIYMTNQGPISYSDSWAGVNITAQEALSLVNSIYKLFKPR